MANDPPEVGRRGRVLWDGEPPVELEATHQVTTLRGRGFDDDVDPRFQLGRDSAIILIGLILAVLVAQTFLPSANGVPSGSASPFPSEVAIGSLPPRASLAPGETLGAIIGPSLDIDATPTPIPAITSGPTPPPRSTPTPRTTPTLRPTPTPKPPATLKPTKTPKPSKSPTPTTAPTPTPEPTSIPTPEAHFSCTESPGLVLSCSESSTDADSWLWDWGDGTTDSGRNPPDHTYAGDVERPVHVTLTVTGPGPGSGIAMHSYDLIP